MGTNVTGYGIHINKISTSETEARSPSAEGRTASNPTQEATAKAPVRPDRLQISHATAELGINFYNLNSNLQFSLDEESGELIVKVLDTQTKEIIRQIPTEQALALAQFFRDLKANKVSMPDGQGGGHSLLEGLLIHVKV